MFAIKVLTMLQIAFISRNLKGELLNLNKNWNQLSFEC